VVLFTSRTKKQLIPLIERNIELNKINHRTKAIEFNWGDDTSSLDPPFDIILLSDVVANCYKESLIPLMNTLYATSNDKTLILLAYEKRDITDLEFFKKLAMQFDYKKIPNSHLDELWQSEDIGIFTIKKMT